MNLIIPEQLTFGDTIGFISPSAGLAPFAPHRIDRAISFFEKMGFSIIIGKNALKNNGYVSASINERLDDLHEMFSNQKVKAIICTIGGNNSNQLLPFINYKLITDNPKILIGYSDISVLHFALQSQSNLATYYGPCVMTQFGEYPNPLSYTWNFFSKQLITGLKREMMIVASEYWTDDALDWFKKKDLLGPRKLYNNVGYQWLKPGKAKGKAWGGSIPSITYLVGTKFWVKPERVIFFLDIPQGNDIYSGLSLSEVDAYLVNLFNIGVFDNISGLVIGRPYRYSEEDQKRLKDVILRVVERYDFPILYNANIGHADPIITLRYGQEIELNSERNLFRVLI